MDIALALQASDDAHLQELGCRLRRECRTFRRDLVAAVEASIVRTSALPFIPPWPGYTEPFPNLTDPISFPGQPSEWLFLSGYANYRFYPEMLSARILPRRHTALIRRYRERHGGEWLWLNRNAPRQWLEPGRHIAVSAAPTPWGRVSYRVVSELGRGRLRVQLSLPAERQPKHILLRLRCPRGWRLQQAESAAGEVIPVRADDTLMLSPRGTTDLAIAVRCIRRAARPDA